MSDRAVPFGDHQQIGAGVPLAGLEKQDRALGGHLPGDAVADGGVADGLFGTENHLGGGAVGAHDPIDLAGRIDGLADARIGAGADLGAYVGDGGSRSEQADQQTGEQEGAHHRTTSGSAR